MDEDDDETDYEYRLRYAKHYGLVDLCFAPSGLFLGASGAVGVGYFTGFFHKIPNSLVRRVPRDLSTTHPIIYKNVKAFDRVLTGGSIPWRVAKRAIFGAIVFCIVECPLQGKNFRRRPQETALAGAFSGFFFGARAGMPNAVYATLGFSAYALASYYMYH